jgi:transcriptional regulator with XRE-family HTH domain
MAATPEEEAMAVRLKTLRGRRGLSQSRLAGAAGIPVGSIRGWEQARRRMAMAMATAVETVFREPDGGTRWRRGRRLRGMVRGRCRMSQVGGRGSGGRADHCHYL